MSLKDRLAEHRPVRHKLDTWILTQSREDQALLLEYATDPHTSASHIAAAITAEGFPIGKDAVLAWRYRVGFSG